MTKKKNRYANLEKNNENVGPMQKSTIPKGLINLGNTCYLNSVLQCISRISLLPKWIEHISSGDVNGCLKKPNIDGNTQSLRVTLPKMNMEFSQSFVQFVEKLCSPVGNRSLISPDDLRRQIGSHYPQFANFGQHDSHEVLRCILDCMRNEEKRTWQKGLLKAMCYNSSAGDDLKEEIKSWRNSFNFCTTVDRAFGGVILSSIQCTVCKSVSLRFETFLDLSIPLAFDEPEPYNPPAKFKQEKKNRVKKSQKGKRGKRKRRFISDDEFEDSQPVANRDEDDCTGVENGRKARSRKRTERKSTKKNKYGRKRWLEEESDGEAQSETEDEAEVGEIDEDHQNVGGKEDYNVIEKEVSDNENANENPSLPEVGNYEMTDEIFPFSAFLDFDGGEEEGDIDNASLELNHGSLSDFQDIMVDDFDIGDAGDSNRSTGSPENIIDFAEDENQDQEKDECYNEVDTNGLRDGEIRLEKVNCESTTESSRSSQECDSKSIDSISAGEVADSEDNADDAVSSAVSGISLPQPRFEEEEFCKNFDLKSSIVEADDTCLVAQPEEEIRAKELSILSILDTPSHEEPSTDLERCLRKFFETEKLTGDNKIICEECTKRSRSTTSGSDSNRTEVTSCGSSTCGDVRCDSLKRDLLLKLPAILNIQLKRYQKNGYQIRKCSRAVSFPINLDMRPYCSRLSWLNADEGLYRLFGIVEHTGSLSNGHYVAYVAETSDGDIPSNNFLSSLDKPFPWPLNLHHLVYQLRRADSSVLKGGTSAKNLSDQCDSRTWHYFSDATVRRVSLTEVLNANPYLLFYERIR